MSRFVVWIKKTLTQKNFSRTQLHNIEKIRWIQNIQTSTIFDRRRDSHLNFLLLFKDQEDRQSGANTSHLQPRIMEQSVLTRMLLSMLKFPLLARKIITKIITQFLPARLHLSSIKSLRPGIRQIKLEWTLLSYIKQRYSILFQTDFRSLILWLQSTPKVAFHPCLQFVQANKKEAKGKY